MKCSHPKLYPPLCEALEIEKKKKLVILALYSQEIYKLERETNIQHVSQEEEF